MTTRPEKRILHTVLPGPYNGRRLNMPDIDIDFADRSETLKHFKHVSASIDDGNGFKKHNTGVYCSRQRPRIDTSTDEADEHTPTSGSFGNDTPRQTLSDWERLGYGDDGSVDEAGE